MQRVKATNFEINACYLNAKGYDIWEIARRLGNARISDVERAINKNILWM